MILAASTTPVLKELQEKTKKQCQAVELKLPIGFNEMFFEQTLDSVFKSYIPDVLSVHPPFLSNQGQDLRLEFAGHGYYAHSLLTIGKLCQALSEHYEHKIIMVMHNGISLENYWQIPSLSENTTRFLNDLLNECPDVDIAIENSMLVRFNPKYEEFDMRSGGRSCFDVAEWLDDVFGNNKRVGTCFNTCHAILENRLLGNMYGSFTAMFPDLTSALSQYSIESFFDHGSNFMKLVHLSNARNHGVLPGEHNCLFSTDEDMEVLGTIIEKIEGNCSKVPVIVKVNEKEENSSDGYLKTKEMIESFKKQSVLSA